MAQPTCLSLIPLLLLVKRAEKENPKLTKRVQAYMQSYDLRQAQNSIDRAPTSEKLAAKKLFDLLELDENVALVSKAIQLQEWSNLKRIFPKDLLELVLQYKDKEGISIQGAFKRGFPLEIAKELAKYFCYGMDEVTIEWKTFMFTEGMDFAAAVQHAALIEMYQSAYRAKGEEDSALLEAPPLTEEQAEEELAKLPSHERRALLEAIIENIVTMTINSIPPALTNEDAIAMQKSILEQELRRALLDDKAEYEDSKIEREMRRAIQQQVTSAEKVRQIYHNLARMISQK